MTGYCPKCGQPVTLLLLNGKGYCEQHGWVWVNWNPPNPRRENHALPAGNPAH